MSYLIARSDLSNCKGYGKAVIQHLNTTVTLGELGEFTKLSYLDLH
jgi:hypothetical protein